MHVISFDPYNILGVKFCVPLILMDGGLEVHRG